MRLQQLASLLASFVLCAGAVKAESPGDESSAGDRPTSSAVTRAITEVLPWAEYPAGDGPGAGRHIVLISGDEEYRSEETCPMLGKILARHHGFRCTVLFAVNPETGQIDPNHRSHIPGLEKLEEADLMLLFTRFRSLSDEQMQHIDQYVHSGKPIIGLRTATHAFDYPDQSDSPYAHYDWQSRTWPGGFGQQVLGETWISHHGKHNGESTRGIINWQFRGHPMLEGVRDVWGPTDVYGIRHLGHDADVLMFGQILEGMEPSDRPVVDDRNNPMMPLVWTRTFTGRSGKPSRVVCTTMGASVDLESEGLRRLLVNACYWALEMEEEIPERAVVELVDPFEPTYYGFGEFKKEMTPADYQ